MQKSDLIEKWRGTSFSTKSPVRVTYPCGKDAIYYFIYMPEDMPLVNMMSQNRLKDSTHHFQSGTDGKKIEAAESFGGYISRYELNRYVVTHYTEACGSPSLFNIPQERTVALSGNRLTLSCANNTTV